MRQVRSAAVWVAIAAMAVRALMPVGWMPATASQNHAALMPCPMMDGMRGTAVLKKPAQPHSPARHQLPASHEGSICAFATAVQAVRTVEPYPIELAPPGFAFFAPAASAFAPSWDHAPRAPPPIV